MAKYDKLLAKMVMPFGYQEMKALEPRVTATEAAAAALGSQLNGIVISLPEAPAWEELDRIKQVLAFSLIPGHRNVGGIDAGLWAEGLATDWPPDWILGDWLHEDTLSFFPWTPNPAWVPFPAPGVATTGTLPVTALPSTPISGQLVRLTTADDAANAAPGIYSHDGTGWSCVSYAAAYALGNLGATPSLSLIPGAAYTATVNVVITTFTVAFTRPGLASITLTNAGTLVIAQPSMAGRTRKLLAQPVWDGAAMTLSKALLEDDGVYLVTSVGGLA